MLPKELIRYERKEKVEITDIFDKNIFQRLYLPPRPIELGKHFFLFCDISHEESSGAKLNIFCFPFEVFRRDRKHLQLARVVYASLLLEFRSRFVVFLVLQVGRCMCIELLRSHLAIPFPLLGLSRRRHKFPVEINVGMNPSLQTRKRCYFTWNLISARVRVLLSLSPPWTSSRDRYRSITSCL